MMRPVTMAIWLLALIAAISYYLLYPQHFSPEALRHFFARFGGYMLAVYALVSIVRGFFLIPSTPFIFAGVLLFPTKPDWVLALSVLGVGSSATLVYFFSAHMGWDRFFRDKNPAQLAQLKTRLESKYGLAFIALWSFFPAIPTDLICYVAGVVRIRYQYFIAALLLGELPLIAAYVYGGSSIFTYIEKLMASW